MGFILQHLAMKFIGKTIGKQLDGFVTISNAHSDVKLEHNFGIKM
jgi:hypothetical protein